MGLKSFSIVLTDRVERCYFNYSVILIMAEIIRQFPRSPSIYGRHFENEREMILDLAHDTYRRCHFKNCEVIIPDTQKTLIQQTLFDCQFDDCQITLLHRVPFDLPYNRNRRPQDLITTLIAGHIDIKAMPGRQFNLSHSWIVPEIKDRLGMQRTMGVLRNLANHAKLFSYRLDYNSRPDGIIKTH
jgi:hypothetical protein